MREAGRHGAAIGVEAREGLRVDRGRLDAVGGRQRIGQRQEASALGGEEFSDGARRP